MKKIIKAEDLLRVQDALDKLYSQHTEFNINTAIKLSKLKKEIDSMCKYIVDRMCETIPNIIYSEQQLTDNEQLIYNLILSSEIEVDNNDLTMNQITESSSVKLDISSAEYLGLLF